MATARPSVIALLLEHGWRWLRQAVRILHRLWLEITGALFLGLAAFAVPSLLREWRAYQAGGALWKPVASIAFMVMMTAFAVYSFVRSRRLR
ncbi:MAG TPA: hypothetical protein VGQ71_05925 [Terriglobales bacterium]|jgi:uncharacterized membrane protein|nr:hypothetical protein [Terriglobales bacterium]